MHWYATVTTINKLCQILFSNQQKYSNQKNIYINILYDIIYIFKNHWNHRKCKQCNILIRLLKLSLKICEEHIRFCFSLVQYLFKSHAYLVGSLFISGWYIALITHYIHHKLRVIQLCRYCKYVNLKSLWVYGFLLFFEATTHKKFSLCYVMWCHH